MVRAASTSTRTPPAKAPARWHVGDAGELVGRAASKMLAGWGRADRTPPDL
ncbi:hypothetical protein [Sphingomonas sp.]|uniref:hypothetical protein n=1 Tax=Sphingomonas sp. TaxID=28214 RepID=UPI0025DF33F2|nr:hypothetical protein [Sphingomonas sp.]